MQVAEEAPAHTPQPDRRRLGQGVPGPRYAALRRPDRHEAAVCRQRSRTSRAAIALQTPTRAGSARQRPRDKENQISATPPSVPAVAWLHSTSAASSSSCSRCSSSRLPKHAPPDIQDIFRLRPRRFTRHRGAGAQWKWARRDGTDRSKARAQLRNSCHFRGPASTAVRLRKRKPSVLLTCCSSCSTGPEWSAAFRFREERRSEALFDWHYAERLCSREASMNVTPSRADRRAVITGHARRSSHAEGDIPGGRRCWTLLSDQLDAAVSF